MTLEIITLIFQGLVLVMLGVTTWRIWEMRKIAQRTNDLIGQYRREIGWLTHRIETLEQARQLQREISSK